MRGSFLIHCVLVLALCLGQIATNAHVIGHLHSAADHTNHLSAHLEPHPHQHQHQHASDQDSAPASVEVDCSAYHAFAGLAGLNPTVCNAVAVRSASIAPTSLRIAVIRSSIITHSIRGPPLHS